MDVCSEGPDLGGSVSGFYSFEEGLFRALRELAKRSRV